MTAKSKHIERRNTRSAYLDGRVSSASRASKANSHTWKFGCLAILAVVLSIVGPTSARPAEVKAASFIFGSDSGGFKYMDPNDPNSPPVLTNAFGVANPWLVFRQARCMSDPACNNYCDTHDCSKVARLRDNAPSTGRAILNVVKGTLNGTKCPTC